MDVMLTAAEEYARNIRKLGKPNLTFNQLLYAWHKALSQPQMDDESVAKCIEIARNPLAIEMISLSTNHLDPTKRTT